MNLNLQFQKLKRRIEAVPEIEHQEMVESVKIHDDLVVTPTSSIKLLRDGCKWLGISQAGSKGRMFDRIVKARDLAVKLSIVEVAQEQFRSKQPEVASVPIPPKPSEKDRKDHEMTYSFSTMVQILCQ